MIEAGVLTISDKGSRGEREDLSGEAIRSVLAATGARVARTKIVPDDLSELDQLMDKEEYLKFLDSVDFDS